MTPAGLITAVLAFSVAAFLIGYLASEVRRLNLELRQTERHIVELRKGLIVLEGGKRGHA